MIKSRGAGGLPFASNIGDSLELMKKMWGMAGLPNVPSPGDLASMAVRLPSQLPSMVAPTIDVEELDRRISDLRAVENWLELNANMVRATIQTLEIQRATVATLKSFGGGMIPAMLARSSAPPPAPAPAPTLPTFSAPPPVVAPTYALAGGDEDGSEEDAAPVRRRRKRAKTATRSTTEAALNPSAWWNTLQDQFTKIAGAALAPAPVKEEEAKPTRKAARKRKRKARARAA